MVAEGAWQRTCKCNPKNQDGRKQRCGVCTRDLVLITYLSLRREIVRVSIWKVISYEAQHLKEFFQLQYVGFAVLDLLTYIEEARNIACDISFNREMLKNAFTSCYAAIAFHFNHSES